MIQLDCEGGDDMTNEKQEIADLVLKAIKEVNVKDLVELEVEKAKIRGITDPEELEKVRLEAAKKIGSASGKAVGQTIKAIMKMKKLQQ